MYVPPHFDVSNPEVLHDLIVHHPLGVLITQGESGLNANHIPFELEASASTHGILRAHVARNNPVWQLSTNGDEVLVVFQADDAYISPNWYPSKHETHQQVPTWNYRVVHAYGKITVYDDEKYVRALVGRLTKKHEANQPKPWKMSDAPRDYMEMMVKSIVGIEIEITRLIGKFKLSQNRENRDRLNAAKVLVEQGNEILGKAMLDVVPPK
jgi:transcriptional regulator